MKFTVRGLNIYTFFKLPSVWWCGVRVVDLSEKVCSTKVKYRWINQNPFKSLFWAVQGMAAELAAGVLILNSVRKTGRKMSTLVLNMKASFYKKAVGRIIFTCDQGETVEKAIEKVIDTGESQTLWLKSSGIDENKVEVSSFDFEWTLKLKDE